MQLVPVYVGSDSAAEVISLPSWTRDNFEICRYIAGLQKCPCPLSQEYEAKRGVEQQLIAAINVGFNRIEPRSGQSKSSLGDVSKSETRQSGFISQFLVGYFLQSAALSTEHLSPLLATTLLPTNFPSTK